VARCGLTRVWSVGWPGLPGRAVIDTDNGIALRSARQRVADGPCRPLIGPWRPVLGPALATLPVRPSKRPKARLSSAPSKPHAAPSKAPSRPVERPGGAG
jgi:hypothetical protein